MRFLTAGVLLCVLTANAAIDKQTIEHSVIRKSVLGEKKNAYLSDGVFFGGEGGRGFSLLDIRRHYSAKDKIERVVLEMGDAKGKVTPKLGYFQVSINKELRRVDIDLSQMSGANVDQKKIEAMFEKSPVVQSAKINYDPEDQGIVLQLQLVAAANVEVFKVQDPKKSGRIIVDLKKLR